MSPFWQFWQSLPSHMHPDLFKIGPVPIRWYSIMYMVALAVVFFLTAWRIRRGEVKQPPDSSQLLDLIIMSILGIIIGGRVGYVIFYDPVYYWHHPLEAFLPFSFTNGIHYTGFSGMSFHGGLIGVLVFLILFCRRRKWPVLRISDTLVAAIPLGYTFGRIGNFINGELYGRVTHSIIGMHFPLAPGPDLRYPSQLFAAFFEGLFLFAVLWPLRNKRPFNGFLTSLYLFGYGFVRFFVEFFRQPDPQLGFVLGPFTMGQVLCALMMAGAVGLYIGAWRYQHSRLRAG
jgi:phosphatidylglycerol---prolipoprotein diacylglyceryl transferase